MHIHYLQHVPFEGLGSIKSWVHEKGFNLTSTRLFDNEMLPSIEEIDWLIIMGGPMFVYEEDKYPWLIREKAFIHKAIMSGKQVLGIFLGAQLLAEVLGGAVSRSPNREIGWFLVELTPAAHKHPLFHNIANHFTPFHWHSDTFSIPKGAERIAFNQHTVNQGFVYGNNVLALQFHLETTEQIATSLIKRFAEELTPGSQVQSAEKILANQSCFTKSAIIMHQLLDNLYTIRESHYAPTCRES